ncbi:N-6 DNA methylase [endosymbiont of Riftia pachyptila]
MAVITSLSVLYRGGSDGDIRQRLIEHNLLDAVVVLPDRLLPNTSNSHCCADFPNGQTRRFRTLH